MYQKLLVTNELTEYLSNIDEMAILKIENIVRLLAEKENVDERLKSANQLKWVGLMNNFKSQAEEIVLNELIYN